MSNRLSVRAAYNYMIKYLHFYAIRFTSLMEGHIWLESEGIGKGCTAIFIVKLGICENQNGYQQQIVPSKWLSQGDTDLLGPRPIFKEENRLVPSRLRYQRSV